MLKDAQTTAVRGEVGDRHRTRVVDPQHLSRRDIADEPRADGLERAGLARHEPGVAFAAEAERTDTERGAQRVEGGWCEDHERPRALELRQSASQAVVPRRAVFTRDDLGDHLGVARGRELRAGARELFAQVTGVDAVAVVTDR